MKLQRNKTLSTTALILILTVSAIMVSMPAANAHTPAWNIPTYAYVTCSPSTVGVGQYTQIVMWLDKYPPTAEGPGGDRWQGFKLVITKPDGTTATPTPNPTSQVGTTWVTYVPDQVGTYTIVFSWPGQTLTNGTGNPEPRGVPYVGDYFQPSTSDPFILHVQQTPIASWVEPPLPTSYWTRPTNAANRGWSSVASNWLKGNWFRYTNFQEGGQAPNSPHIVWAQPLSFGGVMDERWPGIGFGTMDYEFPWQWPSPIIMNGQVFLDAAVYPKYGYYAVDLLTGEQLWYKNGTDNGLNNPITYTSTPPLSQAFPQLQFGQLYHYHSVNGNGMAAYLWMTVGTTWYMLDATTGNWILTLKNVPAGTAVTDQDGSLLRYSYNPATGKFLCWNSSQSIPPMGPLGTDEQQWKPRVGAVIDAVNDTSWTDYGLARPTDANRLWTAADIAPRSGYTMNVTGPTGLPPLSAILQDANYVPQIMLFSDMRNNPPRFDIGSSDSFFQAAAVRIDYNVAPYSPYPNATATQNNNLGYGVTLLWNKNITRPLGGNLTWILGPISYDDKVFTIWDKETRQWWGYSLTDGSLLWGPTASQNEWDMYGNGGAYADGKLFSGSYGGVLYAYDIKTGKLLWNYTLTPIGYESPYGNGNFPVSVGAIADGKVYVYSTEHSPSQPLWRGSYLRCINETDGKELWKILDYNMGLAVADGYIVTGNMYDIKLYSIGKGPSATTVTASPAIIATGSSVLIQGTVTDQSPGAKGTPAISDASMEQWMEYLYEQQQIPGNATGVPVTLTALDPNGNTEQIGTVTSDMTGLFSAMWTPPVPGKYTVIASFGGSKSYGSSYAECAFGVGAALAAAPASPQALATPPPTSEPTQTTAPSPQVTTTPVPPPSSAGIPTTYIIIAVVAIVIVVAAAALVLRRRK